MGTQNIGIPEFMTPCSQCGGSGVLRLSDQRYRTCLECLGQGQRSGLAAAITTAALFKPEFQPGFQPKGRGAERSRQRGSAAGFHGLSATESAV
jgi:hypothetical protein